jgi:hypothetical protein
VAESGIAKPAGKIPIREIAVTLESIGGTIEDLEGFLKEYAGRWKEPPATWPHVAVSVAHWAADPKTARGIQRREACRIDYERRAAKQASEQLVFETPTEPEAAMADATARGLTIPRVIRGRIS